MAKAKIEVRCPKCKAVHMLEDVIEVPKIIFEDIKKCDLCGSAMEYLPDMIDIEDKNRKPILTASGILRCNKCTNEEMYNNYIGEISKDEKSEEWVVQSGSGNTIIC